MEAFEAFLTGIKEMKYSIDQTKYDLGTYKSENQILKGKITDITAELAQVKIEYVALWKHMEAVQNNNEENENIMQNEVRIHAECMENAPNKEEVENELRGATSHEDEAEKNSCDIVQNSTHVDVSLEATEHKDGSEEETVAAQLKLYEKDDLEECRVEAIQLKNEKVESEEEIVEALQLENEKDESMEIVVKEDSVQKVIEKDESEEDKVEEVEEAQLQHGNEYAMKQTVEAAQSEEEESVEETGKAAQVGNEKEVSMEETVEAVQLRNEEEKSDETMHCENENGEVINMQLKCEEEAVEKVQCGDETVEVLQDRDEEEGREEDEESAQCKDETGETTAEEVQQYKNAIESNEGVHLECKTEIEEFVETDLCKAESNAESTEVGPCKDEEESEESEHGKDETVEESEEEVEDTGEGEGQANEAVQCGDQEKSIEAVEHETEIESMDTMKSKGTMKEESMEITKLKNGIGEEPAEAPNYTDETEEYVEQVQCKDERKEDLLPKVVRWKDEAEEGSLEVLQRKDETKEEPLEALQRKDETKEEPLETLQCKDTKEEPLKTPQQCKDEAKEESLEALRCNNETIHKWRESASCKNERKEEPGKTVKCNDEWKGKSVEEELQKNEAEESGLRQPTTIHSDEKIVLLDKKVRKMCTKVEKSVTDFKIEFNREMVKVREDSNKVAQLQRVFNNIQISIYSKKELEEEEKNAAKVPIPLLPTPSKVGKHPSKVGISRNEAKKMLDNIKKSSFCVTLKEMPLLYKVPVCIDQYSKIEKHCDYMDSEAGVYTAPLRGRYECRVGRNTPSYKVELSLCIDRDEKRVDVASSSQESNGFYYKTVCVDCEVNDKMWLEASGRQQGYSDCLTGLVFRGKILS